MDFVATHLAGVFSITAQRHIDGRGFFSELYSRSKFEQHGIFETFVQDNFSSSKAAGTVRGLHFQVPPCAQAKLVRCTKGSLFDVAVDLRRGSPTYGGWYGEVLSFDNGRQLYIPEGFAHGFMTLEDDTEIFYKCSDFYAPEFEGAVRFDDPDIAIDWPRLKSSPILSEKDASAEFFLDLKSPFCSEISK